MSERSARETILSAVRAAKPTAIDAPDVRAALVTRPPTDADLVARFTAAARAAAADVVEEGTVAEENAFACDAVLGVAENGAVWLTASALGTRSAFFLAESVVVRLDRRTIVNDLHDAYARLDIAAEEFGAFVTGPSKTADIEQSLVVGAQGPKRLTVVLTPRG